MGNCQSGTYYGTSNGSPACLPCPAGYVCPGGGSTYQSCPSGQIAISNACRDGVAATCSPFNCPAGFYSPVVSSTGAISCKFNDNSFAAFKTHCFDDTCYYDSDGKNTGSNDDLGICRCPSPLTQSCTCPASNPYSFGTNCLPACVAPNNRFVDGTCGLCPQSTIYSSKTLSCLSCGDLSVYSAPGQACQCNPAANAIIKSDGTCGCAAPLVETSGSICSVCPQDTTYSSKSQTCVSCGDLSIASAAGQACQCNSAVNAVLASDGTCGCPSHFTEVSGMCQPQRSCTGLCADGTTAFYQGGLYNCDGDCVYYSSGQPSTTTAGNPGCSSAPLPLTCTCPSPSILVGGACTFCPTSQTLVGGNCVDCPPGATSNGRGGACSTCPANTVLSTAANACLSCGPLSLPSTAGQPCQCNAAAMAVTQSDGTCGCPTGYSNNGGTCQKSAGQTSCSSCPNGVEPSPCNDFFGCFQCATEDYTCEYDSYGELRSASYNSDESDPCPQNLASQYCYCPTNAIAASDSSSNCYFCNTLQTYSADTGGCVNCPAGQASDGMGGPCQPLPSSAARLRNRRTDARLLSTISGAYKSSSQQLQVKRNAAIQRQKRSTWA